MQIKIVFDPMVTPLYCENVEDYEFWAEKGGSEHLLHKYFSKLLGSEQGEVIEMTATLNGRVFQEEFATSYFSVNKKRQYNHLAFGHILEISLEPVRKKNPQNGKEA